MQKIIIAVLLLVMASVPVAAHAMVVIISEDGIPTTFPRPGEPPAGDSIAGKYTQGSKVYCEAASNGALGAKFLFRESGDIKDMVISYLICINASPTDPATLKLYFNHFFPVTNIDSRYYVMSVQGSFFNINSGGPGHGSPLNASSYVTFFNSGLQPSNPVPIGASSGSFTAAFGPQSPRQLVNLLNCPLGNCANYQLIESILDNITLAPGDGIYLYGSQHTGSTAQQADARDLLAALTANIDVLNNNSVGVNTSGTVLLVLFGARDALDIFEDGVLGPDDLPIKFDVKDVKELKFGPLGGGRPAVS